MNESLKTKEGDQIISDSKIVLKKQCTYCKLTKEMDLFQVGTYLTFFADCTEHPHTSIKLVKFEPDHAMKELGGGVHIPILHSSCHEEDGRGEKYPLIITRLCNEGDGELSFHNGN